MKSRLFAIITIIGIGAFAIISIALNVPTTNAQAAPGPYAYGGIVPTSSPSALRARGNMQGQSNNNGLIGVAADTLGMTRQALLIELQNGKTIEDVAIAKHVDPLTIVDAFVAPQFARIDALVQSGVITQKQADDAKASMRTHITVLVSSPIDSWVRQAHDPLIGQRPNNAGQGPNAQPGGRGSCWNR